MDDMAGGKTLELRRVNKVPPHQINSSNPAASMLKNFHDKK